MHKEGLDAIIEVTGSVEYAAGIVLAAIAAGKHVVLMNAELDGTLGAILKAKADRAGVIITNADGDQPGVMMNLYRFVRGIGVRPVLVGNIKGLHDPYRNPTTQEGFAQRLGAKPSMVTSFADGTKISFEQTIVANAAGMRVAKRGMIGPDFSGGNPDAPLTQVEATVANFAPYLDKADAGLVDYVRWCAPGAGRVRAGNDDSTQKHYLNLYKLDSGRITASTSPIICATSRCRPRWQGRSCSTTPPWWPQTDQNSVSSRLQRSLSAKAS